MPWKKLPETINARKSSDSFTPFPITAEKIKIAVGSVLPELEVEPEPFLVRGPNLMTGHPGEALIPYQDISH
ncbi:MAG: hypothetical protein IKI81_06945, partial [Selenomonadaceae bacterium]|nr:hypothetical protein [Selenomonadaceae bacterium]